MTLSPFREPAAPLAPKDDYARSVITRETFNDERVLWVGRPHQGLKLAASDAFMIPFSVMWGGFAIFWEATVLTMDAPLLMKLWGIPFVIVGLHLMVGRFFQDAFRRRRTYYGVTNRRALTVLDGKEQKTQSFTLDIIQRVETKERSNGSGTITFNTPEDSDSSRRQRLPAFEGIPDVREVARLLDDVQRTTR